MEEVCLLNQLLLTSALQRSTGVICGKIDPLMLPSIFFPVTVYDIILELF